MFRDKIRYFNKKTKKFEFYNIGTVNTQPYTDATVYEKGQYSTGMLDKKAKLIYEGDIIRKSDCNALGWGRVRICEVYWHKEWLCWEILTTLGDGYLLSDYESKNYEIIGNIYQTPHLLTEKED